MERSEKLSWATEISQITNRRINCDQGFFCLIVRWGRLTPRIDAWGIVIKDTRKCKAVFSERYYGYWGQLEIGPYLFRTFWPRGHLVK